MHISLRNNEKSTKKTKKQNKTKQKQGLKYIRWTIRYG